MCAAATGTQQILSLLAALCETPSPSLLSHCTPLCSSSEVLLIKREIPFSVCSPFIVLLLCLDIRSQTRLLCAC